MRRESAGRVGVGVLSREAVMGEGWGLGWRMEHEAESTRKFVGR